MLNKAAQCSRCDTPLTGNEQRCPNCQKPLVATTPALSQRPANCPVCKIPIYPAKMADLEILHCAECEGTAYQRETLMRMQPNSPKEIEIGAMERDHKTPPYFEPRDKPPFLGCPFCSKRMQEKRLGPMSVDICEKCKAIWLEGTQSNQINEILSPYKTQSMSQAKGRRSRR